MNANVNDMTIKTVVRWATVAAIACIAGELLWFICVDEDANVVRRSSVLRLHNAMRDARQRAIISRRGASVVFACSSNGLEFVVQVAGTEHLRDTLPPNWKLLSPVPQPIECAPDGTFTSGDAEIVLTDGSDVHVCRLDGRQGKTHHETVSIDEWIHREDDSFEQLDGAAHE